MIWGGCHWHDIGERRDGNETATRSVCLRCVGTLIVLHGWAGIRHRHRPLGAAGGERGTSPERNLPSCGAQSFSWPPAGFCHPLLARQSLAPAASGGRDSQIPLGTPSARPPAAQRWWRKKMKACFAVRALRRAPPSGVAKHAYHQTGPSLYPTVQRASGASC